jgi:hypothetical protein
MTPFGAATAARGATAPAATSTAAAAVPARASGAAGATDCGIALESHSGEHDSPGLDVDRAALSFLACSAGTAIAPRCRFFTVLARDPRCARGSIRAIRPVSAGAAIYTCRALDLSAREDHARAGDAERSTGDREQLRSVVAINVDRIPGLNRDREVLSGRDNDRCLSRHSYGSTAFELNAMAVAGCDSSLEGGICTSRNANHGARRCGGNRQAGESQDHHPARLKKDRAKPADAVLAHDSP